jgi:hypothetical protein
MLGSPVEDCHHARSYPLQVSEREVVPYDPLQRDLRVPEAAAQLFPRA